jgi:hypothetical protein
MIPAIQIEQIVKRLGAVEALAGVSLGRAQPNFCVAGALTASTWLAVWLSKPGIN